MINLKIRISTKHVYVSLIKNNFILFKLSTNTAYMKNILYRTNNISAINCISILLAKQIKSAGIKDLIILESNNFKGKKIFLINNLNKLGIPISVKVVKNRN